MKKLFFSAFMFAALCLTAHGQNVVQSLAQTTGVTDQYSATTGQQVLPRAQFEPKSFDMDLSLGYSGANSTYNSEMGDIVSGLNVGLGFYFGKRFVFNTGFEAAFYFPKDNVVTNLNFPIRIGFQKGWGEANSSDRYFRLLTGPVLSAYNLDSAKFNCMWDVRMEYEIGRIQLFIDTAWGICNLGNSDYKVTVNSPISVGLAIDFF